MPSGGVILRDRLHRPPEELQGARPAVLRLAPRPCTASRLRRMTMRRRRSFARKTWLVAIAALVVVGVATAATRSSTADYSARNIADIVLIDQHESRYTHLADSHRFREWSELWTENGVLDEAWQDARLADPPRRPGEDAAPRGGGTLVSAAPSSHRRPPDVRADRDDHERPAGVPRHRGLRRGVRPHGPQPASRERHRREPQGARGRRDQGLHEDARPEPRPGDRAPPRRRAGGRQPTRSSPCASTATSSAAT